MMRLHIGANVVAWLAVAVSFGLQLAVGDHQLLHVAVALCTVGLLWRIQARSFGFWDPATLYIAMSSLYVLSPVLEIVLLGNTLAFDPARMAFLANAGTGYLLAAGLAISLVRAVPSTTHVRSGAAARLVCELETISTACAALCAVYVALITVRYGLSIGGIGRAELYAEEFVALSLTRLALVIGLMYAVALFYRARALRLAGSARVSWWLFGSAAVFIGLDLLILGDRRMGVTLLLAIAPLFLRPQVKLWQLLALTFAAAALLLFSLVRNAPPSEWLTRLGSVDVLAKLSPAAAEFGIVAVIGGAIEDPYRFPADFPTYEQAFLQLLPRAVLPDRPAAPSEWFVWHYFPDYAATGGSFAFSSVVEALGNGGLVGVTLAGLVAGAALALVGRIRLLGTPVGLCFATFIFVFSMRMELAVLLRNTMYLVSVMILFLVLGAVAWQLGRRRSSRPPPAHDEAVTHG